MNPFALTPQEQRGGMMAPGQRQGRAATFMDNLEALRAMMGPSAASRMIKADREQQERLGRGDRSPSPLTEDRVWLADDVAGAFVGPMGMAGVIKAYHGSPHRFDKFSMDKIGTGEGAQAYGHGIYMAESPETARTYRTAGQSGFVNTQRARIVENALSQASDKKAARHLIHEQAMALPPNERQPYFDAYNNFDEIDRGAGGALYTTRLDVEPDDLLDWDKPLSEQSEKVRAALEGSEYGRMAISTAKTSGFGTVDPSGKEIYQALQPYGEKGASTGRLREAGIPGIRYLDQGSRASGEGTRNFVIFDDSLITIEAVD